MCSADSWLFCNATGVTFRCGAQDRSVHALIDTQVMERGTRGAASVSESVLTGAAIAEYDRCALQTPGNAAKQLVSLVASQHGPQSALQHTFV